MLYNYYSCRFGKNLGFPNSSTNKVRLIQCMILHIHLYLGGVWLVVNRITDTKKTCVGEKIGLRAQNF